MRKIFTKLLSLMALCLLYTINARAASDEKGNFIYYAGTGGFYNLQLQEAEYGWYDNWKLYETSPGSNVYARLFTSALSDYTSLRFNFYTELSDANLFSNDYHRRNIIVAGGNGAPGSTGSAAAINQSRIYCASLESYKLCTDPAINYFTCPKEKGAVYIVVDMNNKKVSVIPAGHYLMVLKGQPEPDFGNLTDYISADEDHYFEPGDYEFNMYALDAKIDNLNSPKWVIPTDDQVVLYDNGAKPICNVKISSHNRDSHFIIRNWPGGIIHPYAVGAKFSPDKNAAQEDVIYVNVSKKPFLPWSGCSEEVAQTAYRLTKNGDKYIGTFPYDDIADGFNLIVEPGAKGQPAAKVLCPPTDTDIDLHIVDDCAYAPVAVKTGDKAAYYRSYKSNGKDVNIEVTPGDKPTIMVSYTSSTPTNEKTGKYLRGSFTDWSPLDAWEFVTTSIPNKYVIRDVTIPEGSQFKVADANWAAINWGACDYTPLYPDRDFKLNTASDGYSINIQYGYGFGDFRGDVWLLLSPTGEWILRFSTDTNETPDPTEDPQDKCPYFVWDRNNLSSFKYDEIQGMYYCYVGGTKDMDELSLNLFAKELPYECHDEHWAGSWAINAPYDNYVLEFDEYGVAESTFTVHEGITTEKPAQFILRRSDNPISDSWGNWTYHLYIDKDAQKLYAYKGQNCAIFGSFNDYEIPSIKNREKFANWYLPHYAGGLFDFPQGDVDYTHLYYNGVGPNAFSMKQIESEFTVTMGSEGYVLYNWAPNRAIVKDWKGGKALIAAQHAGSDPSYFIDDSIINEFNFIGWEGRLAREAADSDIYTGEVTVDPAKLPDNGCFLNLQLSPDHSLKFGSYWRDSSDFDENGEITIGMGIGAWGSNSLYNPCITAPCRFKATFDLKKLELTLKLIDGQLATKFEFAANGCSDLDGLYFTTKGSGSDCVSFSGTASNEVSFNLVSNTGQIVAPASDTEIVFDKYGYWEGKSVDMAKTPARMHAAARKAADASAKWHFKLPAGCEGSALVMEYDIASNTLRLHSSAHNGGFFVMQESDAYDGGISDLDALKENRLEMTSDGIFEGEIKLNPTGNGYYSKVKFSQSINPDCNTTNIAHLSADAEGSNNPVLSAENPVADYWAWSQGGRNDLLNDAQWWEVSATKPNVHVKFDASRLAMQFTMDTAGVEDVIADRNDPDAIVITTGNGTITFTASADINLPIYSISGATVRVLNLSAGSTTINIAAGYYIAAGQKIMVR